MFNLGAKKMEIHGTQFTQSIANTQNVSAKKQVSSSAELARTPAKDEVQISQAAQNMSDVSQTSETSNSGIRFDLVNRIRGEIAAGTYDTPEKLDSALEKMLAQIG